MCHNEELKTVLKCNVIRKNTSGFFLLGCVGGC